MIIVSVDYTCKYRLNFANNYVWTICGKCYNLKSGRFIKQVYNSGCIGYTIKGKYHSLKHLKTKLELIPKKRIYAFLKTF